MNSKIKPIASMGLVGLVISSGVIWLVELFGDINLIGEGAPMFGPVPASSIFILVMGIVGAVIGGYRNKNNS
jgi:hypothetical protein